MKPTVFYTLFLGIFLAGGLAGQAPRLVLPVGHTNNVDFVTVSPDNKKVISSSSDKKLKLWELNTGFLLLDLPASTYKQPPEFSSNGNYFLVNTDSIVFVYSGKTGEIVYRFEAGKDNFFLLAKFTPDGRKLGILSLSKFELIELQGGKTLMSNDEDARSFAFSSDGNLLALDMGTEVRVYEQDTGEIYTMYEEGSPLVKSFSFSPDGKQILIVYYEKLLRVWNTKLAAKVFEKNYNEYDDLEFAGYTQDGSGIIILVSKNSKTDFLVKRKQCLILHPQLGSVKAKLISNDSLFVNYISSMKLIPDSDQLLTSAIYGGLAIWDLKSGKLLWSVKRPESGFNDVDITRDSKYIVAAGREPHITVLDVRQKRFVRDFQNHSNSFTDIRFIDSTEILFAPGGQLLFWDTKTGQPVNIPQRKLNNPVISQDGKHLTEVLNEELIFLNPEKYTTLKKFKALFSWVEYSPDGDKILLGDGKQLYVMDTKTGKVLSGRKEGWEPGLIRKWSANGKYMVSNFSDDTIRVLKASDLSVAASIFSRTYAVNDLVFSPDSKQLVIAGKSLILLDIESNAQVGEIKDEDEEIYEAYDFKKVCFSKDGKRILSCRSFKIKCWDIETKELLFTASHENSVRSLEYSKDGKMFASSSWDNTGAIWNAANGKLLYRLPHTNFVNTATFSSDGLKVVTTGDDNICKVWNTSTGQLLYSFVGLDDKDYLLIDQSGYYSGTHKAAKSLHYVSKDLRTISFEQLDIRFNRPDKVLTSLGNSDTTLISFYRKAWEKRVKKLGIDTTVFQNGFAVPDCNISNRDSITYDQAKKQLLIKIKASDEQFILDRFNCWVNDVPIFGQRGISIKARNNRQYDTSFIIQLSTGTNRIEAVVTNINGAESYRIPLIVNYAPAVKEKEFLHFIGIGIDRFTEKSHDLEYSVKDIRDLSKQLKKKYGNAIRIDTLFNDQVNTESVKALKQQLMKTTENDKVILAYSGHGLLSKDYDYFLSTYSVNFDNPEKNGLPYDELESLLDSIPARRKLMLIDACHSGEVDKEEMTRITDASESLQQQGTKGGKPTYTGKITLGMKNSFELMQSLFVNVGKSTGATVISAAAGTQFALERGDLKNGVFTYSILEAMNKFPSIKISELRRIVGERVEKLTNGLQKPTSRNETISSDWEL